MNYLLAKDRATHKNWNVRFCIKSSNMGEGIIEGG